MKAKAEDSAAGMQIKAPGLNRIAGQSFLPVAVLGIGSVACWFSVRLDVYNTASQTLAFMTMAIWFYVLAALFLARNHLGDGMWCTAPAFMTILAAIEFVSVPLLRFATGADVIDSSYVRAMFYTLIGFSAFWLASWIWMKPNRWNFSPEFSGSHPRLIISAISMLVVGAMGNMVMWKLGLIGYATATLQYEASISGVQALGVCSSMLGMATVVSGIEILGKHSRSGVMRVVFGCSLVLNCGFGIISGMKVEILMPILSLALLLGIVRGRLPRLVWAIPMLFIIVGPFVEAYRVNLNAGYVAQINTESGLADTVSKTLHDVSYGYDGMQEVSQNGIDQLTSRLSDLSLFREVLDLPSPSLLNGDESIWMAPVYPFIPRMLWKSKPILNKGQRMSGAMGIGEVSSTNIPGIADLYVINGVAGIVIGMFCWGGLLQIYMNVIGGLISEKGVFIYVSMLFALCNVERDMVGTISGAVQSAVICLIVAQVAYGGRLFSVAAKRSSGMVPSI